MLQIALFCFINFQKMAGIFAPMNKDEIDNWAKNFAAALCVGGERVPLDRVIAPRLSVFEALRNDGLTWRAIAAILTRAGARRKDDGPISPDQLRADVSRLLKRKAASPARLLPTRPVKIPAREARSSRAATVQWREPAWPPESEPRPKPVEMEARLDASKDVTESDIAAALSKLAQK